MDGVEYRITGIFRYRTQGSIYPEYNRHVVDSNKNWSLNDAKRRLAEIQAEINEKARIKKVKAMADPFIAPYQEIKDDYDLLALRIESRTVTPWTKVGE